MPRSIQVFRTAIVLLAAATSVIVGLYAGIYISTIREGSESASLVARAAALILPLVGVAILVEWQWLIVMVTYVFGFHSGYTAFDRLGDSIGSMMQGVAAVLAVPSAWLAGSELPVHGPVASSGFQNHPELLWYYDLAVLFVSVAAILRHQRKSLNNAQQVMDVNRPTDFNLNPSAPQ